MDDDLSWNAIIHNFGFLTVAVTKFTDDYSTSRYLMVYNTTQIKYMINEQNKIHFNRAVPNQRCYINGTAINRLVEFQRWVVFAVKDAR